jgi:ribose transport system permease protein
MKTSGKTRSWLVPINRLLTLGILAVMFVVFSAFAHNFFTVRNVLNLLVQTSTYTIVAICAAFVMIVGGIDFSLSVVVMLSGHVVMWLAVAGVPIWLSMIVAASLGGITGFINGFAVAKLRPPSFLATMGTAMIAGGALGVVAGYMHLTKIPDSLGVLGNVPVFRIYACDGAGANTIVFPGISWIVIIMVFLALLCQFVATKTVIGRHAYLVGSNQEAARFSGIKVCRVKLAAFMLAGLLAGLVGVCLHPGW